MASTNKTTHFDLPQWIGTDKPTFLGDLNGAFSTIDTQLYTAVTNAENANNNATSAAGAVSDMQEDVNDLKTWQTTAATAISGLQTSVNTLNTNVMQSQLTGQNVSVTYAGTSSDVSISDTGMKYKKLTIGGNTILSIYGYIHCTVNSAITLVNFLDKLILNFGNIGVNLPEIFNCGIISSTYTEGYYSDPFSLTAVSGQPNQLKGFTHSSRTFNTSAFTTIDITAIILTGVNAQ